MVDRLAASSRVVWLGESASRDPRVVGPKAAHLSALAEQHSVPPGFCVTAAAYRSSGGAMSPELVSAVTNAYERLEAIAGIPNIPVAVRSSALDEDGPLASFAGQHATLLNISGIDEVLAAIESCWGSARSDQAIAYRRAHGLSVDDIGLAVLVQQLVVADTSGVMFSANPVSGRRDELIVTASWGLGESIVGGSVTPDSWVVDRDSREILEERLGDKRRMTVAVKGGSREIDVPRVLRSRSSLAPNQVREVATLG